MGLRERRAIKAVEETNYPELKQKISDIVGYDLEFEIDWASLINSGSNVASTETYAEDFTKIFFEPLVLSLTDICQDDMGKEAIQEALKKIIIVNTRDNYSSSSWSTFEDGNLTLDHEMFCNVDHIERRAESLSELLNGSL